MIAGCKYTGFCNMIPLFINIFGRITFRSIPDNTKGFEFISVRFYNITVIDMYNWLCGNPFFDNLKLRVNSRYRSPLFQMHGEAVNSVNLFSRFVKLVCNICQEAASRSQHAISDVRDEFLFRS